MKGISHHSASPISSAHLSYLKYNPLKQTLPLALEKTAARGLIKRLLPHFVWSAVVRDLPESPQN